MRCEYCTRIASSGRDECVSCGAPLPSAIPFHPVAHPMVPDAGYVASWSIGGPMVTTAKIQAGCITTAEIGAW